MKPTNNPYGWGGGLMRITSLYLHVDQLTSVDVSLELGQASLSVVRVVCSIGAGELAATRMDSASTIWYS